MRSTLMPAQGWPTTPDAVPEESYLRERERHLDADEQILLKRERELQARAAAVVAKRLAVERMLHGMSCGGNVLAQELLEGLPRVPPPPGAFERRRAARARERALRCRESAANARLKMLENIHAALDQAVTDLADTLQAARQFRAEIENDPAPPPAPLPVPAGESRRASPRHGIVAQVTLDAGEGAQAALAYDVSEGGMFIGTYDVPAVGQRVQIGLVLATGATLRLDATVQWVRAATPDVIPGVGVKFTSLSERDMPALFNLMGGSA